MTIISEVSCYVTVSLLERLGFCSFIMVSRRMYRDICIVVIIIDERLGLTHSLIFPSHFPLRLFQRVVRTQTVIALRSIVLVFTDGANLRFLALFLFGLLNQIQGLLARVLTYFNTRPDSWHCLRSRHFAVKDVLSRCAHMLHRWIWSCLV